MIEILNDAEDLDQANKIIDTLLEEIENLEKELANLRAELWND